MDRSRIIQASKDGKKEDIIVTGLTKQNKYTVKSRRQCNLCCCKGKRKKKRHEFVTIVLAEFTTLVDRI